MTPETTLVAELSQVLEPYEAGRLAHGLSQLSDPRPIAAAVAELLGELRMTSAKVNRAAIESFEEFQRRVGLDVVVPWLDLGVALAGTSGAAGMKYFKESPLILGLLDSASTRRSVLTLALELADSDANVALEFLRSAPEMLATVSLDELSSLAEVGVELARWDYVLGIEFFRQSPVIAQVIAQDMLRDWVAFAMKLITQNSLGKTDYLGTLEFFRTAPAILGDIEGSGIRKGVIDVGSVIANENPALAITFLAEAPAILRRIPSEGWRQRVLRYGALVAERDGEAALAYIRRSPDISALIGESALAAEKFEEWFKGGMEVLEYSPEGARAYFSVETQHALTSVEQAISGIPLRQVARQLKLFAEALCGTDVRIEALPDSIQESGKAPARATVSADGRVIALPSLLRRYSTKEENVRLYTVMTAHEAGHLEFGTYRLAMGHLSDVIADVRARYGKTNEGPVSTLADLFAQYPQPGLIRDLWTVLEDARVEFLLQEEYPGLRRDLAAVAREAATTRSLLHGLTVREMIVDSLLLLSTQERVDVQIPEAIAETVDRTWAVGRSILASNALAEDVVRAADRIYLILEEMATATRSHVETDAAELPQGDQGGGPKASEETSGDYRTVMNWAYRGVMNPDLVGRQQQDDSEGEAEGQAPSVERQEANVAPRPPSDHSTQEHSDSRRREHGARKRDHADEALISGGRSTLPIEEVLAVSDDQRWHEHGKGAGRGFVYDEWDGLIRDYRSGWCHVVEEIAPEESGDFADATLTAHAPAIRLLRRYFESMRPPAFRRVPSQPDGEEIDLDAAVRWVADRAAGVEPSDRMYVRREKRERDVAAAFLVDLSGSTSRQIEGDGRRVIDVEKEGLVLLSEALGAVGDQFAIYGYSGQGRHHVGVTVVKEFDEPAGPRIARRIGSMVPLQQNRDGAAIRHATAKVMRRSARTRLLILISDGKPLDNGYADEYSLEDTRMALREARMAGVEPFCITVDRESTNDLRRMYGEVRFVIIDRVGQLPERLPRIYQRLTA